jgi:dephospho-CoA kinase
MQNTGVFDYCIWVDRSNHLEAEATDSMSLEQWMSDFTIDNNGTLEDLKFNLDQLMNYLEVRT